MKGGGGRYHLKGGVGGRQRGGGGGGVPCQLETRSNNLHRAMMRQQITLLAKMGDLGGGTDATRRLLRLVMTSLTMRGRRTKITTVVRSWEEKEGGLECKIQICCDCHHQDKGGREDLMIATPGRDDAHTNSAACTYMVLLNIKLAAGEGGGAAQDAVEDDGGGMVMGGGEDHGKDCGNTDGNGHGHGHGHGQCIRNDAKSIGGG
jgi:hypothetical protein